MPIDSAATGSLDLGSWSLGVEQEDRPGGLHLTARRLRQRARRAERTSPMRSSPVPDRIAIAHAEGPGVTAVARCSTVTSLRPRSDLPTDHLEFTRCSRRSYDIFRRFHPRQRFSCEIKHLGRHYHVGGTGRESEQVGELPDAGATGRVPVE